MRFFEFPDSTLSNWKVGTTWTLIVHEIGGVSQSCTILAWMAGFYHPTHVIKSLNGSLSCLKHEQKSMVWWPDSNTIIKWTF